MAAGRPWNDRLFEAIALPPLAVAAVGAAALLLLLGVLALASDSLDAELTAQPHWWLARDVRLAILIAVLAAFAPAARRWERAVALESLRDLRAAMGWGEAELARAEAELDAPAPRSARRAGAAALAVVPAVALLVDREPGLYLRAEYWRLGQLWAWALGAAVAWNVGVLAHATLLRARRFAALGARLPAIDLLDLEPLAPFARQGTRSVLPLLVVAALFALNLVDEGFRWPLAILIPLQLVFAAVVLRVSVSGVRERLREAKRAAITRANTALRRELSAGLGEGGAEGRGALPVGDLLAWRHYVAGLPEWPFEAGALVRFGLYAAIPLGSWLGGALVERLIDAFIG
jgi:hypothetical protein